jgi:hypothetical protein
MMAPYLSVDNRDMREVDNYQQARIEALQKAVRDLMRENAELKLIIAEFDAKWVERRCI